VKPGFRTKKQEGLRFSTSPLSLLLPRPGLEPGLPTKAVAEATGGYPTRLQDLGSRRTLVQLCDVRHPAEGRAASSGYHAGQHLLRGSLRAQHDTSDERRLNVLTVCGVGRRAEQVPLEEPVHGNGVAVGSLRLGSELD